jgi:acetyl esterase
LNRRERLERASARLVGALPEPLRRAIAGPPLVYDGETLDSRIGALMAMSARMGRTFRDGVDLDAFRRAYRNTTRTLGIGERRPVVSRDLTIPLPGGGTIGARLLRPANAAGPLPLLVYYHGGGYVIGDIEGYDDLARFFACEGAIAVLNVDYRLGPEHRFPAAHEDGFTAFAWACANAADLGTDPARIAIGGDSAGGAIAATVSAHAESRGIPLPARQFLIYPGTSQSVIYPSRRLFDHGVPLTPALTAWFGARYVRSEADFADPLFSPLAAPHPERTPPTYLLAAGFDPLVDEGRAYADRLRAAGVDVVYDLRPTLSHAFVNFPGVVPEARRALRDAIRAVAAALRERAA